LSILSLVLITFCSILEWQFKIGISLPDAIWLTLSFFVNSVICIGVFMAGQSKEPESQPFFTLVSITLKFLIELIIALIWFLIAKKTSISFILLFFVLYLTFTTFSIAMILNTLKNKSL
jgi:hypothetical protein